MLLTEDAGVGAYDRIEVTPVIWMDGPITRFVNGANTQSNRNRIVHSYKGNKFQDKRYGINEEVTADRLYSSQEVVEEHRATETSTSGYSTPALPSVHVTPTKVDSGHVYNTMDSSVGALPSRWRHADYLTPTITNAINPTPVKLNLMSPTTIVKESLDIENANNVVLSPGRYRRNASLDEFLKYISSGRLHCHQTELTLKLL